MPVLEAEITILDVVEEKPLNGLFEKQGSEVIASESVVTELTSAMSSHHTLLVTRTLRGEQEAFNDIVTQYSSLMLRTARMIVGDQDIAEDVVQDALIQAWHHLPELREKGALRSWLMRIVVNQCISFKRKVARSSAFIRQSLSEQEMDMMAQLADDHKGRIERDWDLAEAIKNLPVKQRAVIVLHYYYGMTLPEMARSLGTSENTLKKRIQAALATLRRILSVNDRDDAYASHPVEATRQSFAISAAW